MAFNYQAQIQLTGPANLGQIVNDIQRRLQGINATVDVKVGRNNLLTIKGLTDSVSALNRAVGTIAPGATVASTSIRNLGSSAQSTVPSLNNMLKSLGQINSTVISSRRGLDEATKAIIQFGEQSGLATRRFLAFSLAAGSIVSLVYSLRQGVRSAVDFEKQLVRLQQVGDGTRDGIREISDEITRVSTSYGSSSRDLARVSVTLRQAGLSADQTRQALDALAQSTIAPTFENIEKTTEGLIATFSQFNLQASQSTQILGVINRVSADLAVESTDIIDAIRRAGGAFSSLAGPTRSGIENLQDFIAIFSSVRATTRESAETIATGLRTIFARLQRRETVDALRELGINLRFTAEEARALGSADFQGQFVGVAEAIERISSGLRGISPASETYARVVEQLGGIRQISRVLPLLSEAGTAQRQRAQISASLGPDSLQRSTEVGLQSLSARTAQVYEQFQRLFRLVVENQGFQVFVRTILNLAEGFAKVLQFLTPLIPLLLTIGTIKLANFITPFASGFVPKFLNSPNASYYNIRGYATGGKIGGSGNKDSEIIAATPGEYVLRKDVAQKVGYQNLDKLNNGGPTPSPSFGLIFGESDDKKATFVQGGASKFQEGAAVRLRLNSAKQAEFQKLYSAIETTFDTNFGIPKKTQDSSDQFRSVKGTGFDGYVNKLLGTELDNFDSRKGADLTINNPTVRENLTKYFEGLRGEKLFLREKDVEAPENGINISDLILAESKLSEGKNQVTKGSNQLITSFIRNSFENFKIRDSNGNRAALNPLYIKALKGINLSTEKQGAGGSPKDSFLSAVKEFLANQKPSQSQLEDPYLSYLREYDSRLALASGGIVPGIGNTDSVPMDLPSGSFVIRKSSAKKFGYDNLNRLASGGSVVPSLLTPGEYIFPPQDVNRIGVSTLRNINRKGFASGGRVGFQGGDRVEDLKNLLDEALVEYGKRIRENFRSLSSISIDQVQQQLQGENLAKINQGAFTGNFSQLQKLVGGQEAEGLVKRQLTEQGVSEEDQAGQLLILREVSKEYEKQNKLINQQQTLFNNLEKARQSALSKGDARTVSELSARQAPIYEQILKRRETLSGLESKIGLSIGGGRTVLRSDIEDEKKGTQDPLLAATREQNRISRISAGALLVSQYAPQAAKFAAGFYGGQDTPVVAGIGRGISQAGIGAYAGLQVSEQLQGIGNFGKSIAERGGVTGGIGKLLGVFSKFTGPFGAVIGGAIGVVGGFLSGMKEKERELREIDIKNRLQDLAGALTSATNSLREGGSISGVDRNLIRTSRQDVANLQLQQQASSGGWFESLIRTDWTAREAGRIRASGVGLLERLQADDERRRDPRTGRIDPTRRGFYERQGNREADQRTFQQIYGTREAAEFFQQSVRSNVRRGFSLEQTRRNLGDDYAARVRILGGGDLGRRLADQEILREQRSFRLEQSQAGASLRLQNLSAFDAAIANSAARLEQLNQTFSDFNTIVSGSNQISKVNLDKSIGGRLSDSNFETSLRQVSGRLGGVAGSEFLNTGLALRDIRQSLPSIIRQESQTLVSGRGGSETRESRVRRNLRSSLGLNDSDTSSVRSVFANFIANRLGAEASITSSGTVDPIQLTERVLSEVGAGRFAETFSRFQTLEENRINSLVDGLNRYNQAIQQATTLRIKANNQDLQTQRIQARFDAQNEGYGESAALNFLDPNASAINDSNNLNLIFQRTRLSGTGETADVGSISRALEVASREAFQLSGDNSEEGRRRFSVVSDEASRLRQSLEYLSDTTNRTADSQERLNRLQQSRDSRADFNLQYATADFQQRAVFDRGRQLLTQLARNPNANISNLSARDRRDVVTTARSIGNAILPGTNFTANEILRRSASRLEGVPGFLQAPQGEANNIAELQQNILRANNDAAAASRALANNIQTLSTTSLNNLNISTNQLRLTIQNDLLRELTVLSARLAGAPLPPAAPPAPPVPPLPGAATGGLINELIYARRGFEPRGTDTIPAMLSPGEFVVNAESTRRNLGLLRRINNNRQSESTYFFEGGLVGLPDRLNTRSLMNPQVSPIDAISGRLKFDDTLLGNGISLSGSYRAATNTYIPQTFINPNNINRVNVNPEQLLDILGFDSVLLGRDPTRGNANQRLNYLNASLRVIDGILDRENRNIGADHTVVNNSNIFGLSYRIRNYIVAKKLKDVMSNLIRIRVAALENMIASSLVSPFGLEEVNNIVGSDVASSPSTSDFDITRDLSSETLIRQGVAPDQIRLRQQTAGRLAQADTRLHGGQAYNLILSQLLEKNDFFTSEQNQSFVRDKTENIQNIAKIRELTTSRFLYRSRSGGDYTRGRGTNFLFSPTRFNRSNFRRFAEGGFVDGFGGVDSIPAFLSPGEYVLNPSAVNRVGVSNLNKVNYFQNGGPVGNAGKSLESGGTNSGENFQGLGRYLEMFSTSSNQLSAVMNIFNTSAGRLAEAMENFPTNIEIQGSHRVEVTLNGAQVLTEIMPEIRAMVVEASKREITKVFKDKLPDINIEE